jgi:hypothetical protein
MSVSQTSTEALDQCRQAAATEAGHLGGASDTMVGGCSATSFGRLDAAAELAAAVNAFDARMRADLAAGERLLRLVEAAIGAVESTVRDTDGQAARRLSSTVA